jgi:hypothetical protein
VTFTFVGDVPSHRLLDLNINHVRRTPDVRYSAAMVRDTLIVLEILIAVAAVAGGVYAIVGAPGIPPEWLKGSAFKTYLVPGVVLLVLVGGSMAAAAAMLLAGSSGARVMSLEAGIVLLAWMVGQLSMIGYRHWTQPLLVVIGVAVVVLSFALPAPG